MAEREDGYRRAVQKDTTDLGTLRLHLYECHWELVVWELEFGRWRLATELGVCFVIELVEDTRWRGGVWGEMCAW